MLWKREKIEEPAGSEPVEFYSRVEKIAGWLNPTAGQRTQDILAWQEKTGISGNLLEIGVFCGKYFGLLLESARRSNAHVLGVDTFQFAPEERVHKEMEALFGESVEAAYTLWKRQSSSVTKEELLAEIGSPRFISIDGAHDYENVFRDLDLAERTVSVEGVIAVDDFLNPMTLGVNQAVNAFFAYPRSVAPVAYISNKLFLAHVSVAQDYRKAIEVAIVNGKDPKSEKFREMLSKDRSHVEQPFFGHSVLLS